MYQYHQGVINTEREETPPTEGLYLQRMDSEELKNKDAFQHHVHNCLKHILNFLQNYLSLCNAHSNEFIIFNLWEKMLPHNIRKELWEMTDSDLKNLPTRYLNLNADHSTVDVQHMQKKLEGDLKDCLMSNKENLKDFWEFSCPFLNSSPIVGNQRDAGKNAGFCPSWIHQDVDSFLKDASRCHLPSLDVLTSLQQLWEKQNIVTDNGDDICIHNFMTTKKSHEVDAMADVCALLTKNAGIDVVVDMGSGKGYLSTQLALRYHMTVVGIDAMTTNTEGAVQRARILGKQWKGLVRNAEDEKSGIVVTKRGKKWKKKQQKEIKSDDDKTEIVTEIPDEVLDSLRGFFVEEECKMEAGAPGRAIQSAVDNNFQLIAEINDCQQTTAETTKLAETSLNTELMCNFEVKKSTSLSIASEEIEKQKKKKDLKSFKENYYPVTMFVDPSLDLFDVVFQALFHTEHTHSFHGEFTRKNTLMLTGLHTCGSLGSSVLDLFIKNPQVKVMCNVACCYHLMEEEFVLNPYYSEDGTSTKPGFPLSTMLREQKVGIGRLARNFASQSLYRLAEEKELKAKAFPRCLLQKIILDSMGYIKDDWKGLRKLDQKTSSMYEYVMKAFRKLELPTDKITPELVEKYCSDYTEDKRKLAAFCQLKVVLAPCIEAVVLLDRVAYLLEQECVSNVYLVQMFDPTKSPRCYGIIAFKKKGVQ